MPFHTSNRPTEGQPTDDTNPCGYCGVAQVECVDEAPCCADCG